METALDVLAWSLTLSIAFILVTIILYGTTGIDLMPYFSASKG